MRLDLLHLFVAVASASPIAESQGRATKPAAFYLAGDSTTAPGAGWGPGFLSTLKGGAIGTDYAISGTTTVSFVHGYWAGVLKAVTNNKAKYTPYVTIQFGHNDQKATANISIPEFETNLKNMVADVKNAGGTPILVTSLSRRNYDSSGKVIEDLAGVVAAALVVAKDTGTAYIDLNKYSMAYNNAIGKTDAWLYNYTPSDHTHLNPSGQVVYGNMVSWLLEGSAVGAAVTPYLNPNATIVADIKAGKFAWPIKTSVL